MSSVRTKYDNKGRVLYKVVPLNNEISAKYSYYYNGSSEEPKRVNKTVGNITEIVYQEDTDGRTIYNLDEENNVYTKTSYDMSYDELAQEYPAIFGDLHNTEDFKAIKSVEVTYSVDDVLLGIVLNFEIDKEITHKFIGDVYNKAHVGKDNFIDITPQKANILSVIFNIVDGEKVSRKIMMYRDGNYVVSSETYEFDKSFVMTKIIEQEAITVIDSGKCEKAIVALRNLSTGIVDFQAHEVCLFEDYPFIPMENNVFTRSFIWDKDDNLISSTTATTDIQEKNENYIHCVQFHNEEVGKITEDYKIESVVDSEGRVIHMFNGKDESETDYTYNDQNLLVEMVVTMKPPKPKKLLYKVAGNQNLSVPIKNKYKWHYTDDGKLLMHTTIINDLKCDFEVYEYDEKGQEIFQADFSTLM